MTRLLIAFALLFAAIAPASAQTRRGVEDPRAFVTATYARYQANPNVPPTDQSAVYSPRLKRLFDAYDAWGRQHSDLVGALDFDWWTNAQEYRISRVLVTTRGEGRARLWVVANFNNTDRREEIRFLFLRQGQRWYLDEAVQGTGGGEAGWTLSALLQRREE